MTNYTFSTFYVVEGRTLQTVEGALDLPISTYMGKRFYGVVTLNSQTPVVVDLNKMIANVPNPSLTNTYADIATAYFAKYDGEDVTIDFFPKVSADTQAYPYRMVTLDPQATTGWDVSFGDVNNTQIVGDLNQIGTLDDLIITAPSGTTLANLLVAVCGIFHSTVVMGSSLYVIDGFATIKQMGVNSVVVCDTTSLGGHTIVPITSDMIVGDATTYNQSLTIKLTGSDLSTVTPLISVDGYLQVLNNNYSVRDNQTLTLHTNRFDLPENFVYSPSQRYVRDVLSINNEMDPFNPRFSVAVNQGARAADRKDTLLYSFLDNPAVPKSTFDNLAFYQARLTSPHSFVILINNPYLFIIDYPMVNQGEANLYSIFTEDMPRGLMFYGRGYCLPYTLTYNKFDAQHLVFIDKVYRYANLYKTGKDNPSYVSARADYIDPTLRVPAVIREIFSGSPGNTN